MMKIVYILDIVVLKWWYKFSRTYQIVHYKGVNLVYANCTSTNLFLKKTRVGLPWGVQWIRIQLPMQGTQVQSLVQEDPTCCRATKAACVPQLLSPCSRAHNPKQLSLRVATKPKCLEFVFHNKRSYLNEKSWRHNWRVAPAAAATESLSLVMKTQAQPTIDK